MLHELLLFDNESIVFVVLKCTAAHVVTCTNFKLSLYGFYQDVYGNVLSLSSKKKNERK